MVREHGGDGEIAVPPTIHALLQARIDSLDGDVRVVMERGSVEGEVFHRGAVAEFSPGSRSRPAVESHLATLVRKELIRSTSPTFPEDEGFRFRHLLIRDAAYESLPRRLRAELHERFADWLSTHELVERDEIVGYHLEQAHRYRAELDAGRSGALRARRSCGESSRRCGARSDGSRRLGRGAERSCAGHATCFRRRRPERRALAPELAFALWEAGELPRRSTRRSQRGARSDPSIRCAAAIVAIVELERFRRAAGRTRAMSAIAQRRRHEASSRRPATTRGSRLLVGRRRSSSWSRLRAERDTRGVGAGSRALPKRRGDEALEVELVCVDPSASSSGRRRSPRRIERARGARRARCRRPLPRLRLCRDVGPSARDARRRRARRASCSHAAARLRATPA